MAERRTKNKVRRANILLIIVSALIAMLLWVILSITTFTDITVRLYDVPIDFSLEGTYAELSGLSVIDKDIETVNISFVGQRDRVSRYEAEDIRVSLDLNNVRASGSYDIPLVVTSVNGDQITDVEIAPQRTVHIEFDHFASKTLSVETRTLTLDMSNIRAADGYVIDPEEIEITPAQVTISGPQDYIDQVTSCVVSFDNGMTLINSINSAASTVTLYSGSAVFDNPRVSLDTQLFNVSVPVYITKTLSLNVGIAGYTDQIDVNSIAYELSPESIAVRSQNSAIESVENISLGFIELKDIYPGAVFNFTIPQNTNYTNISGVEEVQVGFPLDGYAQKSITLSNSQIHLINQPTDYNVTVEQDRLRVTVIGPEELLEELDSSNFVAQVDILDYTAYTGQRMLTASVYAPNYPNVWAYGTYQVYAQFEPVRAEEENSAE